MTYIVKVSTVESFLSLALSLAMKSKSIAVTLATPTHRKERRASVTANLVVNPDFAQRLRVLTQVLEMFSSRVLHIPRRMERKRVFQYTPLMSLSSRLTTVTPFD